MCLVLWMDLEKIKQLIGVLAASDLDEMELVEGDHRVRLVRRTGVSPPAPGVLNERASVERSSLVAAASAGGRPLVLAAPPQAGPVSVYAPLYGIVHLTPAPDAAVFVQPGDRVQAGQTVCVIEAMKMFHEVRVERPGRITAVTVAAGDEVEAGTPLFLLDTTGDDV